jgi:Flp pilus assembly protein TadG
LEFVLLVPVMLLMVFVVVGLGRLGMARQDIDAAARDAARAGSITRSPDDAQAAATAAAHDALAAHDITCSAMSVAVDTSEFRPGGRVRVDLSCAVAMADLTGLWMPGTPTMRARGVAVVDTFRGTASAS